MNLERDLGESQRDHYRIPLLSRESHQPIADPGLPHIPHGDPALPCPRYSGAMESWGSARYSGLVVRSDMQGRR